MLWTRWILLGALSGALAVMAGAFGAHALKTRVSSYLLSVFQTASTYQMFHALALLAVGFVSTRIEHTSVQVAGWSFVFGSVLFSGSLYTMVFTGQRWWGMVTPIGGLALIIGWISLAWAVWRLA